MTAFPPVAPRGPLNTDSSKHELWMQPFSPGQAKDQSTRCWLPAFSSSYHQLCSLQPWEDQRPASQERDLWSTIQTETFFAKREGLEKSVEIWPVLTPPRQCWKFHIFFNPSLSSTSDHHRVPVINTAGGSTYNHKCSDKDSLLVKYLSKRRTASEVVSARFTKFKTLDLITNWLLTSWCLLSPYSCLCCPAGLVLSNDIWFLNW